MQATTSAGRRAQPPKIEMNPGWQCLTTCLATALFIIAIIGAANGMEGNAFGWTVTGLGAGYGIAISNLPKSKNVSRQFMVGGVIAGSIYVTLGILGGLGVLTAAQLGLTIIAIQIAILPLICCGTCCLACCAGCVLYIFRGNAHAHADQEVDVDMVDDADEGDNTEGLDRLYDHSDHEGTAQVNEEGDLSSVFGRRAAALRTKMRAGSADANEEGNPLRSALSRRAAAGPAVSTRVRAGSAEVDEEGGLSGAFASHAAALRTSVRAGRRVADSDDEGSGDEDNLRNARAQGNPAQRVAARIAARSRVLGTDDIDDELP